MSDCSCRIVDEKDMVVDVESRKVVMHAKTKGNTPLGEYLVCVVLGIIFSFVTSPVTFA
jgi:hypothetical protein